MDKVTQILVDIIATALAAALLGLIRAGISWLGTRVQSEKIQIALQEFQTVLEDGVGYVEQTFVRVAKEGGTWDASTQSQALQTCLEYIQNNLTEKTVEILTEDKEDIESWLTAKIESYIQSLKDN